jgi:glycosyltransferase involved in cell wall biosynthesis
VKQLFTAKRSELSINLPANVTVILFPMAQITNPAISTFEFLFYSLVFSIITYAMRRCSIVDAVYVRDSQLAFFPLHIQDIANRAVVKIPAFLDEYSAGADKLTQFIYRKIELFVISRSHRIAVASETFANELSKKYPNNRIKSVIIPAGADINGLAELTSGITKELAQIRVGFIGNVVAWQGVDVLVRAVARIKEKFPDMTLYVIGDGPSLNEARELARGLGINAIFTGTLRREEAMRLLKTLTILVAPYVRSVRSATTSAVVPIKMLEAMAIGVPVVITRNEALAFLRDGIDVIFCEPEPVDVANQIDRLLSDSSLRENIAKQAMLTGKKFDYRIIAQRLINAMLDCS